MDYEKYRNDQIKALGFNPEKLSDSQKNILMQPSEAPENYYQDGEISHAEAARLWKQKMAQAGFTQAEISKVKKQYGI